jgi:hypothetical protein
LLSQLRLPHLRRLDVRGCWRLTGGGLRALAHATPTVETALLGGVTRIDDALLEALPAAWPALRALEVAVPAHAVTAHGLLRLLRGCAHLSALRLTGCGGLDALAWAELLHAATRADVSSHLTLLEVVGAPGLTDDHVRAYVRAADAACSRGLQPRPDVAAVDAASGATVGGAPAAHDLLDASLSLDEAAAGGEGKAGGDVVMAAAQAEEAAAAGAAVESPLAAAARATSPAGGRPPPADGRGPRLPRLVLHDCLYVRDAVLADDAARIGAGAH